MKTIVFTAFVVCGLILLISAGNNQGFYSNYHNDGIYGVNFSSNPPASKTGAPGEATCTQCHAGTAIPANGLVSVDFWGGAEYKTDSTYTVTVDAINGPKNGFEMTILDNNNDAAGSFTAGIGSSVISQNNRSYIRQSSSTGITNWTFSWTAPSTNMGNLTAYYVVNKSNNNGSTSGDSILIGQQTIYISSDIVDVTEMTEYQMLMSGFKVFYNSTNDQLNVALELLSPSKVSLQVRSISGQLVRNIDYGQLNGHSHKKKVDLSDIQTNGVYLISVFVDNYVLTEKVFLSP